MYRSTRLLNKTGCISERYIFPMKIQDNNALCSVTLQDLLLSQLQLEYTYILISLTSASTDKPIFLNIGISVQYVMINISSIYIYI